MNFPLRSPAFSGPNVRFGATINVHYGSNLTPATLQTAAHVAEFQLESQDRIARIGEAQNPMTLEVKVTNETLAAEIATPKNGKRSFLMEAGQSVRDFMENPVNEAERMVFSAERRSRELKLVNDFINPLLIGKYDANISIDSLNPEMQDYKAYAFDAIVTIGDRRYQLKKSRYGMGSRHEISPLDQPETKLTIAFSGMELREFKFQAFGIDSVDYLREGSGFDHQQLTRIFFKFDPVMDYINKLLEKDNFRAKP